MASEEQIPRDEVIIIGSDSEKEHSASQKRLLADADGSHDNQPTHISKRPKFSRASPRSNTSKGSEEGEIEESFSKSVGSQSDSQLPAKSFVPSDPPVFTADTVNLKLPALSQKRQGSWVDRVSDWIAVLCTKNFSSVANVKPATVVSAFGHYVDLYSGLKPGKKRTAKQTVRAMEESGKIATLIANTKPPSPTPAKETADDEDGEIANSPEYEAREAQLHRASQPANGNADEVSSMVNGKASVSPREPTAEQRRYFPSAENPADMCLLCGRRGHVSDACSNTRCKFCGEAGHWAFSCKAIQARCGKCRQLGHETSSCVEKLALTKDEGLACAYCGMEHHLEGQCTEPWRSFHAEGETVLPVIAIHASCAVCGSRNHFASDCSQRGSRPYNPSWTLRNRDLFVDPNCDKEAIEEGANLHLREKNQAGRKDSRMRGHALRNVNVHYSESDDSDMDLLSSRVVPRPQRQPVGRMQMSTNLQMPALGGHMVQPPLPPGPPPPFPPPPPRHPPPPGTSNYGRYQGGPPPSLPPKPPTSTNSNNRGPPPPPPPPRRDSRRGGNQSRGRGGPPRGRGGREGGKARGRR